MNTIPLHEDGITSAVQTLFSTYLVSDILEKITFRKVKAILAWLDKDGKKPKNCLIIGSYLTGAKLANTLGKVTPVTVLDRFSHLQTLLDPGIAFVTRVEDLPPSRWDFIMDTSGLGGINPEVLDAFPAPASFLVEDPCSEGSDTTILRKNQCFFLLSRVNASRKGSLFTGGLKTKTSGTMTLMIEVLQRSMNDAKQAQGVLYSTSPLEHFERLLFIEKNHDQFLASLQRPALIVSSLEPLDCDEVITRNLSSVTCRILDFSGKVP
jgi:hypothetical protein